MFHYIVLCIPEPYKNETTILRAETKVRIGPARVFEFRSKRCTDYLFTFRKVNDVYSIF